MAKHAGEKRDFRITFAVNSAEKALLQEGLEMTNYKSLSEFIREFALMCAYSVVSKGEKQIAFIAATDEWKLTSDGGWVYSPNKDAVD